jgi:hypothetical protein
MDHVRRAGPGHTCTEDTTSDLGAQMSETGPRTPIARYTRDLFHALGTCLHEAGTGIVDLLDHADALGDAVGRTARVALHPRGEGLRAESGGQDAGEA